jgi:hypothetical protein
MINPFTLVSIENDQVQRWDVKDIEDAKYRIRRLVDNYDHYSEMAFLINKETNEVKLLPVEKWLADYNYETTQAELKKQEEKEFDKYNRLKK